jgi:hypothetical protein
MRLNVTQEMVEVRLAWWEKLLGLRTDISDVRVLAEPIGEAMGAGIKVGLRVPWLLFVARTIRLDQVFVVRRGVPGISFAVRNHGALQRVVLSTPQAEEIVHRLQSGG